MAEPVSSPLLSQDVPVQPEVNISEKIRMIERKRRSRVLVYFLGTKPNLGTNIDPEQHRYIFEHLENIGKSKNIDLFLYTYGGDTLAPIRLCHLLREYCEKLSVLVPYKAMSSGTLICLGANEIVMGKLGELSPIDPTTGNHFNPPDSKEEKRIPISVEDVTSYLALAQDVAGIKGEDQTLEIFKDLTSPRKYSLHPLALGNVYRALRLIRDVAYKQLLTHHDEKETEKMKRIVTNLTELLYSHSYQISRKEAQELELKIVFPDSKLETMMWDLYKTYETKIDMLKPFDPGFIVNQAFNQLPPQPNITPNIQLPPNIPPQIAQAFQAQLAPPPSVTVPFTHEAAYIESFNICHSFFISGEVKGKMNPQGTTDINVDIRGSWRRIR